MLLEEKPRLSKEQKADLRQEAKELIREYKAEIADIKREAKKQAGGVTRVAASLGTLLSICPSSSGI